MTSERGREGNRWYALRVRRITHYSDWYGGQGGCRVRNSWYRAFPVGHQEPEPLAVLDHHCSEFCLQLSGQVAESSAGLGWNGPHLLSIAI